MLGTLQARCDASQGVLLTNCNPELFVLAKRIPNADVDQLYDKLHAVLGQKKHETVLAQLSKS